MNQVLQRIAENPVMVAILAIAFTVSMLLFWRRVRKEREHHRRRIDDDAPHADGEK